MKLVALHHCYGNSHQFFHGPSKGFPAVGPINQHPLHLAEVSLAQGKHAQSPRPVRNVGGSHMEGMGQALRIHRDMTFDSGDLLTRIIAFVLGAVGVLDALSIHDTEASFFAPTIAASDLANQLFLKPLPAGNLPLGRVSHSIAGNTGSKCAS